MAEISQTQQNKKMAALTPAVRGLPNVKLRTPNVEAFLLVVLPVLPRYLVLLCRSAIDHLFMCICQIGALR